MLSFRPGTGTGSGGGSPGPGAAIRSSHPAATSSGPDDERPEPLRVEVRRLTSGQTFFGDPSSMPESVGAPLVFKEWPLARAWSRSGSLHPNRPFVASKTGVSAITDRLFAVVGLHPSLSVGPARCPGFGHPAIQSSGSLDHRLGERATRADLVEEGLDSRLQLSGQGRRGRDSVRRVPGDGRRRSVHPGGPPPFSGSGARAGSPGGCLARTS